MSSSTETNEKKKKVPLKNNQVARSISNSEFQDYKNGDTVIFFFKESCPFCRELKPTWNKVAKIIPSRWRNEQMSSSVSSDSPVKNNKAPRVVRMDMNKYDKVKRDIGFPTVPMIAMYKKNKPVVFITTKDRMCSNLLAIIENYYKGDKLPKDKSEYVVANKNGLWPHDDKKQGGQVSDVSLSSLSSSISSLSESRSRDKEESENEDDSEKEYKKKEDQEKEDQEKEKLRRETERLREEKDRLKHELRRKQREDDEERERLKRDLRRKQQRDEEDMKREREKRKEIEKKEEEAKRNAEMVFVSAPPRNSLISSRAQVAYDAGNAVEKKKSIIVPREELKIRELQSENDILRKKVNELESHLKWHQEQIKLLMERLEKEQEQSKRLRQKSVSSVSSFSSTNGSNNGQQEQMLGKFLETLVRNKNKI